VLLPHRFRPPRKADTDKWATAQFLVEHGFYYQHIEYPGPLRDGQRAPLVQVPYSETLRDAKAFVEIYRAWARKKD
jgi:hypothetical protein